MIHGLIQEEDITIVNIYSPNIGAFQYIRKILIVIKGEMDNNIIVRHFHECEEASVMERGCHTCFGGRCQFLDFCSSQAVYYSASQSWLYRIILESLKAEDTNGQDKPNDLNQKLRGQNRTINILKLKITALPKLKSTQGNLQDGRRIGWGDHLLPHKCIKKSPQHVEQFPKNIF